MMLDVGRCRAAKAMSESFCVGGLKACLHMAVSFGFCYGRVMGREA